MDNSATNSAAATLTSSSSCFLLHKIPPEIRNAIYEYAFSPDNEHSTIDLRTSSQKSPNKNLLLANPQAYHEARGLYKTAFRKFWRESQFTITYDCDNHAQVGDAIRALRDEDLERVAKLRISHTTYENDFEMLDARGIWKVLEGEDLMEVHQIDVDEGGQLSLRWLGTRWEERVRRVLAEEPGKCAGLKEQVLFLLW